MYKQIKAVNIIGGNRYVNGHFSVDGRFVVGCWDLNYFQKNMSMQSIVTWKP